MKRIAPLAISSIVALAACGTGATVQEQAGDAVAAFVSDDNDLSDADFDTACVRRAALGLTDEVAQDVVDDDGRVDLDVDDDDRDDVYDFYNCADDRDLARLIEDESGAVDANCLEEAFEADDPSDFLSDADVDRPGRLGDFDQVVSCSSATGDAVPDATTPDTTTADPIAPPATTPPVTAPPTTAPPATTPPVTAPTTTAPPATTTTTSTPLPPAMEETPQPMSDPDSGPNGFAADAEDFLNNESVVEDAVGGDVDSTFCLAPSNTSIGTRFLCFGSAVGFGLIEFEVEITEPAAYLVQEFRESLTADRIVVFIVLDGAFAENDLAYDQVCVREFLAGLSDGEVSTVFDEGTEMSSVDGLAPCIL